jgi:6-phosphogluconolactonase
MPAHLHKARSNALSHLPEAVAQRGAFAVVLTGGSTTTGLYRLLAESSFIHEVDWLHTFVYFGDERCVPSNHPDGNYRMARETLPRVTLTFPVLSVA